MATNPRIPDSGSPIQRPTGGMRPEKPKSGVTGTTLALIVLGLLLAAIIYFMPHAPKATPAKPGAEVPQQPTGAQVQLEGMRMITSPNGRALTVQGLLTNHGSQTINGLGMDVVFYGQNGAVLNTDRVKVMGLKQQGDQFQVDDLTQDPLQPNATRPFRVTVDQVPQGWNHEMPELKVAIVTSHP